jgi:hypothetical protein
MYVFLVLALPLGFASLVLALFPGEERDATKRALFRGLLASIPVVLVARVLGALVPEVPGSALGIFHEWTDRMLPYSALPALLYIVFYRYAEHMPVGAASRRLTSFYAGALMPMGLFETLRLWGRANPYELLVLPILLGTMVLIMPRVAFALHNSYGARLVLIAAATALGGLALCFFPLLFILGLWPLVLAATVGACSLGWWLACPELEAKPGPVNQ